jgi:hypothetical protein
MLFLCFQPQVFNKNKGYEAHKALPPQKLRATDGKDPLARKTFQSQDQSSKTSPVKRTDLETKAAILFLALQILQAGNSKIVSDWIVLEPAMHCWFFIFWA